MLKRDVDKPPYHKTLVSVNTVYNILSIFNKKCCTSFKAFAFSPITKKINASRRLYGLRNIKNNSLKRILKIIIS